LRDQPAPLNSTDQGQWQGECGDFFPKSEPAKVCGDPNDWDSPTSYHKLPNDPDQLYAILTDLTKGRGSGPSVMFHYGIEILRSGLMPAELRGSWYRALAKIHGIKLIDTETNLDGRAGTALGLDDGQEQRQLIIDRKTGEFIGERSVAGPHPSAPWIKPGSAAAPPSPVRLRSFAVGNLSGAHDRLNALGDEMIRIHGSIRAELVRLTEDTAGYLEGRAGRPRELKVHCLALCSVVNRHHTGEDAGAFPLLGKEFPELRPVIEKLEQDHFMVSGLLRGFQRLMDGIPDEPAATDVGRIRSELAGLHAILESHFSFEERRIVDALNSLPAEAGTAESLLGGPAPAR
jgi:hypothetical protein